MWLQGGAQVKNARREFSSISDATPITWHRYSQDIWSTALTQDTTGVQNTGEAAVNLAFNNNADTLGFGSYGIGYYNGASWVDANVTGCTWNVTTWDEIKVTHDFTNDFFDAWINDFKIITNGSFRTSQNDAEAIHINLDDTAVSMWIDDFEVGEVVGGGDTTLPEIEDVTDDPDPQEYNGNVNITANITDDVALNEIYVNITNPDSSTSNTSMVLGSGDKYYLNNTFSHVGQHSYIIWVNDTSDNSNYSDTGFFNITDVVTINILSQSLPDIRWNTTERFTVEFNISTFSTPINQSSIFLANSIYDILGDYNNHSYTIPIDSNQPDKLRANGRMRSSWYEKFNSSGSGELGYIGEWAVHDNSTDEINIISSGSNWTLGNFTTTRTEEMHNSINLVDGEYISELDNTGKNWDIYKNNAIQLLFNMTGTEFMASKFNDSIYTFNLFATPIGNPNSLNVYFANSSYVSGNPAFSPYAYNIAINIGEIQATDPYDYTIGNASYYSVRFETNNTGWVGNVSMTSNFSFILTGGQSSPNRWELSYQDTNYSMGDHYHNFNQSETTRITTDFTDWTGINGTGISHLHNFKRNNLDELQYFIYASDTSGNDNFSITQKDIIDEANLKPYSPIIQLPNGTIPTIDYEPGDIINITYQWLGDANHELCFINTTIHNSTGSIIDWVQNRTITYPDYENTEIFYSNWDSSSANIGIGYYVNITITDQYGLTDYDIQNGTFNLTDFSAPEISNVSADPDPGEADSYVNITADIDDTVSTVYGAWINVTYVNSSYSNNSMISGAGSEWFYNTTYLDPPGIHHYTIWANDTYDNWNSSSGYFTISFHNETYVIGGDSTDPDDLYIDFEYHIIGDTVVFNYTGDDPEELIWAFGDGTGRVDTGDLRVIHTYKYAVDYRDYEVTIFVKDINGTWYELTKELTIGLIMLDLNSHILQLPFINLNLWMCVIGAFTTISINGILYDKKKGMNKKNQIHFTVIILGVLWLMFSLFLIFLYV